MGSPLILSSAASLIASLDKHEAPILYTRFYTLYTIDFPMSVVLPLGKSFVLLFIFLSAGISQDFLFYLVFNLVHGLSDNKYLQYTESHWLPLKYSEFYESFGI